MLNKVKLITLLVSGALSLPLYAANQTQLPRHQTSNNIEKPGVTRQTDNSSQSLNSSQNRDNKVSESKSVPNTRKNNQKTSDSTAFIQYVKPLNWDAVPEAFLADFKEAEFPISAHFGQSDLGNFNVQLLSDHHLKIDLQKVFHKLKLDPAIKHYLMQSFKDKGLLINQVIRCDQSLAAQRLCKANQPIFLANLDLQKLRLDFYIDKKLFETQGNGKVLYLPDPYKRYLSSVFKYNINLSQNFGDTHNNSVASLAVNNITGFGKTHLDTSAYLATGSDYSNADLSQLQLIHDFKDTSVSVGYDNAASVFGSNSLNLTYGYSGGMLGAAWYSTANMVQNKSSSSINPILIFLNQQSTVRIYRGNQLLSVQNYDIGSHEIDTSSFPSGVYQVKIEIYNGNQLLRTETQTVNKPFNTSNLNPQSNTAFALWGGVAQDVNSSDFGLPYAGASIQTVVSRYLMTNLAAYVVGSLSVYEIDNTIALPWEVTVTASAGHDSQGGYGVNVNMSKSFNDWLSGNFYYNQTAESIERSPFSFNASEVGAGISLGMQRLGSLSLNSSYDFHESAQNYYANYSVNLYQKYGLYINANANANWRVSNIKNNGQALDYSVGLTLMYNFDNGSSVNLNSTYYPKTGALQNNVMYTPALSADNMISSFDVGASYNKNPDYKDSSTLYSDLGFNQSWMQGDLRAQAQFGNEKTQTISGSLQGNFVVNEKGITASDEQSDSGLVVDLTGVDDTDMNMVINNTFYPVHEGENFIPLSPYKPYHAYLLQGDDANEELVWKRFDDEFVLYPGNVYATERDLTEVTQVLGQFVFGGKPMQYASLSNSVDKSVTDDSGFFDIKIDPKHPEIDIKDENGSSCTYSLSQTEVKKLHQGSWLGVIDCSQLQNKLTTKTSKNKK